MNPCVTPVPPFSRSQIKCGLERLDKISHLCFSELKKRDATRNCAWRGGGKGKDDRPRCNSAPGVGAKTGKLHHPLNSPLSVWHMFGMLLQEEEQAQGEDNGLPRIWTPWACGHISCYIPPTARSVGFIGCNSMLFRKRLSRATDWLWLENWAPVASPKMLNFWL